MNTRIQQIRKTAKMTQDEFAEKVNYEWLTKGTGDMFIQNKRKSEIADFVGSVLNGEADSFKIRLVEILANLNESEWETLQKLANALADKKEE